MATQAYLSPGAIQPSATGAAVMMQAYISPGAVQPQGSSGTAEISKTLVCHPAFLMNR